MKYIALFLMAVFYSAYLTKLLHQRREGITTMQMGKKMDGKTLKVIRSERILTLSSLGIVMVELWSIFQNLHPVPLYVGIPGMVISAMGVVVFLTSMATMHDSWRVGITTEKTRLVTHGIYSISRNPAFLGFDLLYLGLAIAFPNGVHTLMALFAIKTLHTQIVNEEDWLPAVFGDQYRDYLRKVRRYWGRK